MLMRSTDAFPYEALYRSPSGLFTRRDWESDMAGLGEPPAHGAAAAQERAFALWVHGQAKLLAAELDRLARPEAPPRLARQLQAVADALWADAEWARRRLDDAA